MSLPVSPRVAPTRVVATSNAPVSSGASVRPMPPSRQHLPKIMVMTAVITGAIGLGAGLVIRLGSVTGIGPKIFNTQQSFPPLDGWLDPSPDASPVAPTPTAPAVRDDASAPPSITKPRSRPSNPNVIPKAIPTPQNIAPASPVPSPGKAPEIPLPAPSPDVAPTDNPQPPATKAPTSQAPVKLNKERSSGGSSQ